MSSVCSAVQTIKSGTGSQTQFSFDFPYVFKSEIHVYFWNVTTKEYYEVLTTDSTYPWQIPSANPTIVEFTGTAPPAPTDATANIKIRRVTDIDDIQALFNPGSAIRSDDLNSNFEQLRFAVQESLCPDITEAEVTTYLQNYYWNNFEDTITSTATWTSSDTKIATTAAMDARFQDELSETITSTETWANDDNTIATTAAIDDQIDNAITNDILINGTGLTKATSGGQTTLGIGTGAVDLDRIKTDDIVNTSAYASTWTSEDDKIVTAGALAARHDLVVNTDVNPPSTAQTGKQWLSTAPGNQVHKIYDGSGWRTVAVGQPYSPATTTVVRYVDVTNGSDASDVTGFLPQAPLQSIGRALTLVNASGTGDGTLIKVAPGVYQETLPLRIKKNNISIVGESLRSCFVHPTVATENNDMFEVDSGSYISNLTLLGLKVPTSDQGSRNNSLDNDATYGLPSNQPFSVRFRTDVQPVILKSPYIQNCTHFSDAQFDNANFDPNTFPSTDGQTYSAVAGDQTSAPCGGGLLIDGSAVSSSSPIRSMVVDAFTQITLDGPGILVTNNGYAQLVSFFGTFAHYHAKAKNGGQINLSNCVSDFGRYGLIADGKSPSAIATATASAANSGATTITIGSITTAGSFHGTVSRPLDHMMVTIDGVDYGVVSSSANGSGWDIVLTSGLTSNITNTTVSFALRSYISTGGHTFEFVGVGTDYSDHPDFGGVPIEANQVIELNGGKVWQSSTDHVGKFKAGNVLVVNQVSETVDLKATTVTGNLAVTGTVDGRDVATDGTKLDGIEAGATADQTAAEIRTLVEAATDSNVFTDADHTKLNGIETGATADQTAAEIKTAYESNSDTNAFTDSEKTKLSGIATGAEVNVNADWNASSGDAQILNKPTLYSDSSVDTHLNQSSAGANEVLAWNGSDYNWVAQTSGYSNSSVDAHLNQSSAATNEVLSWNGSDYDWVAQSSGGLSDIVSDTTPQLGGNLDVNGQDIVSVSNGDIDLDPNGSGVVVFKGNATKGSGQFKLNCEQNSHGITIKGPAHSAAASYTLTLPTTDGSANEVLKTDGSGNLSWIAQPSGGASEINDLTDGKTVSSGASLGLGNNALSSYTGSGSNVAIGKSALEDLVSGSNNVAVGVDAAANTTGSSNVAIGAESLKTNVDGLGCVAIGMRALRDNTSAIYNNALGMFALLSNTTGEENVALGTRALQANTTANHNTAVGCYSLRYNTTGSENTAIGQQALEDCTTGAHNVGLGHGAGKDITTGGYNVFLGSWAGYSTGGAISNTVGIGRAAAQNVSTNDVIGIGYFAATSATGTDIIAMGHEAGKFAGNHTINMGYESGRTATGAGNVCIGKQTGYGGTSGNCVFIGTEAQTSSTSCSNSIVIGYQATSSTTSASNEITLGNSSITSLRIPGLQSGASNGQVLTYNSTNGNITLAAGGATDINGLSDAYTNSSSIGLGFNSVSSETGTNQRNTALGYESQRYTSSGQWNTSVGYKSLRSVSTAVGGNAFGTFALSGNGSYNNAFGMYALGNNSSGVENAAFGHETLQANTTGSRNVAVGNDAGHVVTTGSNNTFLGNEAGDTFTTGSNCIALGNNAQPSTNTVSNEITLGDANVTSLRIPGLQSGASNGQVLTYNSTNGNIELATAGGASALNDLSDVTYDGSNQKLAVGALSEVNDAYSTSLGYAAGRNYNGQKSVAIGNYALGGGAGGASGYNDNTAVGYFAGYSVGEGERNTYFGSQAGQGNNSANNNTYIGYAAGKNATTSSQSVIVGYEAGAELTTGNNNTFVGPNAGAQTTTGSSNVAIGRYARVGNGTHNVCIGLSLMNASATGSQNIAIGYQGLSSLTSGQYNTVVGYQAGKSVTTATSNVCIGKDSGYSLTTGEENVSIGHNANYNRTTIGKSVAIGFEAGQNPTSYHTTAVGYQALKGASGTNTSSNNTAVGYQAGTAVTSTGMRNTFMGYSSGKGVTSGNKNVFIGALSADHCTTGVGNIVIGQDCASGGTEYARRLTTGSNNIILGNLAEASASTVDNEITLGNSSISTLRCNTQTISSLSDGRDKTEVEDLPLGLDFIDTLRPVKFKWDTRDGNGKDGSYEAGFIAQDLQSAQSTSNADYLKMVMDENPDRLEAAYGQLIPVLVQAIKDLSTQVKQLQTA